MVSSLIRPQGLAFLALTLTTGMVWVGQKTPSVKAVSEASAMPQRLGEWVGTSVPVDERTFDILETRDVMIMEYHSGQKPPVWLSQVAGFGKRATFHPPEICYVGDRFEIVERGPISVAVHGAKRRLMRLVITRGAERYEAWYWFTANGRVTPSYYQQQRWLLTDLIRGKSMSGSLMRISTPLDDSARSRERLVGVLSELDNSR